MLTLFDEIVTAVHEPFNRETDQWLYDVANSAAINALAVMTMAFTATSIMLDESYEGRGLCAEAVDRRRFDKLIEELGEVGQAYGGMVGENPRKGVTNGLDKVLEELLDVAACALGAYEHFDGHKGAALLALCEQTALKRDRLQAAIEAGKATP